MEPIDSTNPFASPLAGETTRYPVDSDVEATRRKYLSHEASVQSMGLLYLIGGVLGVIYVVLSLIGLLSILADSDIRPAGLAVAGGFVLFGGAISSLQLWSGLGLRKLDPRVRTAATIVAAVGLVFLPIGTLISAYFLWLIHSKKGKIVFSPEYREVIEKTPHIKYKTSIIVWIFLALLLGLLGLAMIGAVVSLISR